jgi:hypothetical protein
MNLVEHLMKVRERQFNLKWCVWGGGGLGGGRLYFFLKKYSDSQLSQKTTLTSLGTDHLT